MEMGKARPFSALQQRLGRKKVSDKMLRDIPVAFLAFDVLYANGELAMDRPLRERARFSMSCWQQNESFTTQARRQEANPDKGNLRSGIRAKSPLPASSVRLYFELVPQTHWKNCSPPRRSAMKA